jgi:hypothetical protein
MAGTSSERDGVEAGEEPPTSAPTSLLPTRRLWPFGVVLTLVLIGGALLAWRTLSQPHPLRVLVAIDFDGYWWEGSVPAAQLADELGEMLSRLGFEPVRAGDPQTAAVLEDAADPRDAARKLDAAFLIVARIRPHVEALPIDGGFFEVRAEGELTVEHLASSEALVTQALTTFAAARDRDKALGSCAESAARQALDIALPAMMEQEAVKAIVGGRDPRLVDQLAPAATFVGARGAELRRANAAYVDLDAARRAEEKGGGSITFHSAIDAEDNLVAVGARGALVTTAPVRPYYSPSSLELLRDTSLETLSWRKLEPNANDELLWRGYNAFTYPSAAATGQVALIEDLYGWARGVSVVAPDGKLVRLAVEHTRKPSEPRMSPDGRALAYVDRACRECPKSIVVRDTIGNSELYRTPDSWALGEFAWLDATGLIVAAARDDELGLWVIDVKTGALAPLFEGDALPREPVSNGALVVAVLGDQLVSIDPSTRHFSAHDVGGRPSAPALSPDGRRVAFELTTKGGPYPNIAIMQLATSKVTSVTENRSPDRFPLFTPDGRRVVFEARNIDPVFGRRRAVVRIASVDAPRDE